MHRTTTAILIDDERLARTRLRCLLEATGEIKVLGEASSLEEAVVLLRQHQPRVVFLDIHMSNGDGFELFKRCRVKSHVVFVTAYDKHAIRAFEVNALDYLVKPVEEERLQHTLTQIQSRRGAPQSSDALEACDRVRLAEGKRMLFPEVSELLFIEAADDYAEVFLRDGTSILSSVRISTWEQRLQKAGFFRIHRGYLANLHHVRSLERAQGRQWCVRLNSGKSLPVGRRRVADLREVIHRFLVPA